MTQSFKVALVGIRTHASTSVRIHAGHLIQSAIASLHAARGAAARPWPLESVVGDPGNQTQGQCDVITTAVPSPGVPRQPFIVQPEGRIKSWMGCVPGAGTEPGPAASQSGTLTAAPQRHYGYYSLSNSDYQLYFTFDNVIQIRGIRDFVEN